MGFYNCGRFQGNLRCWFSETLWSFSQYEIAPPFGHTDAVKVQGIASSVTSSLVLSLLPKQPRSDYQKILIDFPAITSLYNENVQIKHHVTHHIETKGPLFILNSDNWPWSNWRSPHKNSSTPWNLKLSGHHRVIGPLLFIWCPKRLLVILPHIK